METKSKLEQMKNKIVLQQYDDVEVELDAKVKESVLENAEHFTQLVEAEYIESISTENDKVQRIMKEFKNGVHYGVINLGKANTKPTLFAAGAQLARVRMGWTVEYEELERTSSDDGKEFSIEFIATLYDENDKYVNASYGYADQESGTKFNKVDKHKVILMAQKRAVTNAVAKAIPELMYFTTDLEDAKHEKTELRENEVSPSQMNAILLELFKFYEPQMEKIPVEARKQYLVVSILGPLAKTHGIKTQMKFWTKSDWKVIKGATYGK